MAETLKQVIARHQRSDSVIWKWKILGKFPSADEFDAAIAQIARDGAAAGRDEAWNAAIEAAANETGTAYDGWSAAIRIRDLKRRVEK